MRKLDDIIPPSRRERVEESPMRSSAPAQGAGALEPPRYIAGGRRRFPWITFVVAFAIVGASVALLVYFSGARIEVTPTTASIGVNGTYTASPTSDLSYTVISADKVASESVPMTGSKTVSTFASGTITVFNTQPRAERLVTNTRFETESAFVFRIHSALTVPGATFGKPGSATVTVYADKPGGDYNIPPSAFTLPGLAGSPQFAEVTARSSATFSGGAVGAVPIVDGAVEASARAALMNTLVGDLRTALTAQVPSGYVLVSGAATTSYAALESKTGASANTALLKERGTAYAVVFPSVALARAVLGASASTTAAVPATIANPSALVFSSARPLPATNAGPLTFSLAGSADLVAVIDPARLAGAVAGKSRAEAQTILKSFPQVKEALLVLRPFWRGTFPEDPAKITVVVRAPAH